VTECPHKGNAEKQKDCKYYKPKREKPQTAGDWVCLYYRKLNGSDCIHWCDGLYDIAGEGN